MRGRAAGRWRRWVTWGALLGALLAGCGYSATPVLFELSATTAGQLEVRSFASRGTLDPAASSFADGVLLSTRWAPSRDGTEVVELWLDLRRAAVPELLAPSEPPVTLASTGDDLRVTLTQRGADGGIVVRQTPSFAQLVLAAWRGEGNRELAAGSFVLELPADQGALYLELGGLFETLPKPYAPTVLGGDWGSSDPAADPGADPRPVDPTAADPARPDEEVVFDQGCSCPGPGGEEELPDEEEPIGDTDAGGGCDCQGDEEPDPGDPDGGDEDETGGGCQGDAEPDPGDPDGGDDASGAGCECQGDEDPEPTDARLRRGAAATTLAAAERRRPRRVKCERASGRVWWALSPFVAFWWLGVRQRRRD